MFGYLNEGKLCDAVIRKPFGLPSDGRGVSASWCCGLCKKEARFPYESQFAFARKQCDWCLAENCIDLNSP